MDEPVKPSSGRRRAGGTRRMPGGRPAHRPAQLDAAEGRAAVVRAPKVNLGGLDQFTGYVVRRAQVWIFQDFKRVLKELDMTPAQFSVLKLVAANPGIAQARVAEVLCIERARLVQMLDRLEAPGLLCRNRSATDRRSHALHLTKDGARALGRLQQRIEAHERNVVARIGAKGKSDLLRLLAPFLR